MQAFKCPHCGGDVKYDPGAESMSCVHCGSEIRREDYQQYLDENALYATNELVCPQCGAALLRYDDTLASFCCYCGSAVHFTRRSVEDSKPDEIVSFKIDGADALKRYRQRLERSVFTPDWLEEGGADRLVGLYMPYYRYQVTATEHLTGDAQNLHGGGYETYSVDCDMKAEYRELRFDAAEAFPDCLSSTMYEMALEGKQRLDQRAKPFEASYLAGYYADGGSVREGDYRDMLEQMVRADLAQQKLYFRSAGLNVAAENPELKLEQKKLLYPVWLNTHRKGDRVCYAAIDGETGNVAAELPLDRGRFLKLALILTALCCLVLNRFVTLQPLPFLCVAGALLSLMGRMLAKLSRDVELRRDYRDDMGRIGMEEFKRSTKSKARKQRHVPVGFLSLGWVMIYIGLVVLALCLAALFFLERHGSLGYIIAAILALTGGLDLILVCCFEAKFSSSAQRPIRWRFRMKPLQLIKAIWPTVLGSLLAAAVLFANPVEDAWYYAAGIADLLLAAWAALELIRQYNLLSSREIPVFTRRRGGEADA